MCSSDLMLTEAHKVSTLKFLPNPSLTSSVTFMGMYNEALTELQTIHPHELSSPNLEYYYFTIRACYGWMADNTVDLHVKQTYLKKTELYRDSLLKILPQGSNRNIPD